MLFFYLLTEFSFTTEFFIYVLDLFGTISFAITGAFKAIEKKFDFVGILLLATITGVTIGILFSYYIEEIRVLITSIFNVRLFPEEIYFLSQMPSEINLGYIIII